MNLTPAQRMFVVAAIALTVAYLLIALVAVAAGFLLVRDMFDLSPGQQDATQVALLTLFACFLIGRGLRLLAAGTD
jgi:hypothetical protein